MLLFHCLPRIGRLDFIFELKIQVFADVYIQKPGHVNNTFAMSVIMSLIALLSHFVTICQDILKAWSLKSGREEMSLILSCVVFRSATERFQN